MAHQEFFNTLRKDHEEVDQILRQLEQAGDKDRQKHLNHLKEEIMPHLRGEESAFYPPLIENAQSKHDAQEAIKEHKEAEDTLNKLMGMSVTASQWMSTLGRLKKGIQHHVHEEETKIFDHARKVLSETEMKSIMTQFEKEKERAKSKIKAY